MERNPNFQTVKDAGASEVADANVDKITVTENKNNSAQVTDIEQNKVDFMVDPPVADRLAEVKAQVQRSVPAGGVDQHLLLLHEHPEAAVQRPQGAPGHQLRDRPRGTQQDLRRPPAPVAADPAARHARLPGVQALPGTGHEQGETADRRGQSGRQGHHRLDDDEPDRKRIGEYYHDLLTQLGFNATLKVIAGDVYWTTIGNQSTPDVDTGFADWFQDFPHPDDFFRPLLHGDSILPTNGNNYSRVNIPANNAKQDELLTKLIGDGGVEDQYAALDKAYMEQAVWAPYGNEQFTTFLSERMDFDKSYHHLLFNQDYTSFAIK